MVYMSVFLCAIYVFLVAHDVECVKLPAAWTKYIENVIKNHDATRLAKSYQLHLVAAHQARVLSWVLLYYAHASADRGPCIITMYMRIP